MVTGFVGIMMMHRIVGSYEFTCTISISSSLAYRAAHNEVSTIIPGVNL